MLTDNNLGKAFRTVPRTQQALSKGQLLLLLEFTD